MSHGRFIWNELASADVEAAKRFFAATIGWSFEASPMPQGGTYWVASHEGQRVGGLLSTDLLPAGVPSHWLSYLAVDDVDARVALAEQHGATLMRPAFDVPGVGRIAIVREPTGAVMAWMTPAASGAA